MLLGRLLELMGAWAGVFRQRRTFVRVASVLVGLMCALGRRTVTKALAFRGKTQCDWSADYLAFSRSPWDVRGLFSGVLRIALGHMRPMGFVPVSLDDSSVKKTSKVIKFARWLRDALSPPFHVNLKYGLRFVHASVTLLR